MIKKTLLAFFLSGAIVSTALGSSQSNTETDTSSSQYQKIIDEYKAYVASILPKIRDEVVAYRKEIVTLNKQKRDLYQKLSQEAQNYLSKEQEYKKKLPLKRKKQINLRDDAANEKVSPNS